MDKMEILKMIYGEENASKIDSAVPATWYQGFLNALEKLGFKKILNPCFRIAYSYIDNNFGEPIDVAEVLLAEVMAGRLKVSKNEN